MYSPSFTEMSKYETVAGALSAMNTWMENNFNDWISKKQKKMIICYLIKS